MSTNSTITIKDRSVFRTIYCHWDGYIDGVGFELRDNYRNKEAILELLKLGELSALGADISKCVAYHRDRGEDLCEADINESYDKCRKEEYNYLWMHGQWWEGSSINSMKPLSEIAK